MKTAELRTKTADELQQQLLDLGKEQFNLRLQKNTGQIEREGLSRIRIVRRDIARVKTLLAETKSGKAPAAKKAAAPKAKAPAKKKKETKE